METHTNQASNNNSENLPILPQPIQKVPYSTNESINTSNNTSQNQAEGPSLPFSILVQNEPENLSNCEVVACGTVMASGQVAQDQAPVTGKKPRGCSKRLSMDERYRVRELYCNGIPKLRIARMLNLNWRTVQKIAKKVDAGITDLSPLRPSKASKQSKHDDLDETEIPTTSNFQNLTYSDALQQYNLPQQSSIVVLNGLSPTEINGKKMFAVSEDELGIKTEYLITKQEAEELTDAMEEDTSSVSVKSELKDDLDDHIIDVVTPEPEERRVRTKKSVAEALRAKKAAASQVPVPVNGSSNTPSTSAADSSFTSALPNVVHRVLVPIDQISARYSILMRVKCACWYEVGFTLQDIVRLFEAEFGEDIQPPPLEIVKFWHERLCSTGSIL